MSIVGAEGQRMISREASELHFTADDMPVIMDLAPFAGKGVEMVIITIDRSSGGFSCILRAKAGSSYGAHLHLGGVDYLVLSGGIPSHRGVIGPGAGGYQRYGTLDTATHFTEDSEILFNYRGPEAHVDDKLNIVALLDSRWIEEKLAAAIDI
jgi:hypothetical protein